jgi:hypothetical protein
MRTYARDEKNTFGQPVDAFVAISKEKATGEDTGEAVSVS